MSLHVLNFTFPLPRNAAAPTSRWTLDQGVDIAAPAHTPLLAVGSGVIVRHGIKGFGDWAPVLKLDDGGQYVYYGHAGPGNFLKDGTHVKAGQVIGEVGAGRVGISTGPHLEIGFSSASGQPVGHATIMRQLLGGAKSPEFGTANPTQIPDVRAGGVTGVGKDQVDAVTSAARDAFTWGFNQLWGSVKGSAAYGGLFLVAIIAGAWMLVQGVKRTGRTPQPAGGVR